MFLSSRTTSGPSPFFIGVTLAIAVGFRQSAWEPSQGTALYLLHLPLRRRTIFLTKIATGISLLLLCTVLPIVVYATWASLPRTHPGPFEWMMTGPAFRLWLILPLVYLGEFASGIRPGGPVVRLAAAATRRRGASGNPGLRDAVLVAVWCAPAPDRGGGARQRHSLGGRDARDF